MDEMAVCLDDIFWSAPGNIVAIPLQKQTDAPLEFCITIRLSVIGRIVRNMLASYIFFVENVCGFVSLGAITCQGQMD